MAVTAANGTKGAPMQGKPRPGAKPLKAFSEELASAKDACPLVPLETSAHEVTKSVKSTRRSRTTDATGPEPFSVRSNRKEDHQEEPSKPMLVSPNVDKATELKPIGLTVPVAQDTINASALTTKAPTPESAGSFVDKLSAAGPASRSASIATAGRAEPAVSPENYSTPQPKVKKPAPDQVAGNSGDLASSGTDVRPERVGRAHVASSHAVSQETESSVAQADLAPGDENFMAKGSAEQLTSGHTPVETEIVQIAASLEAKNKHEQQIQQVPSVGGELTTRLNAVDSSAVSARDRSESPVLKLHVHPENDTDIKGQQPESLGTLGATAASVGRVSKGSTKPGHNGSAQSSSSFASEISAMITDAQDQPSKSTREKSADILPSPIPVSPAPVSGTPMAVTTEGFETSPSATKLDDAAQSARTRQIVGAHSLLQTAKLTDRGGRTELSVGLNAGELGAVSIRTFMVHNQVKAEISVQKEELRDLLAVGLPEIQNKISRAHDVVAPSIVFSTGVDQGQNSNETAQNYQNERGGVSRSGSIGAQDEIIGGVTVPVEVSSTSGKLDIRM